MHWIEDRPWIIPLTFTIVLGTVAVLSYDESMVRQMTLDQKLLSLIVFILLCKGR